MTKQKQTEVVSKRNFLQDAVTLGEFPLPLPGTNYSKVFRDAAGLYAFSRVGDIMVKIRPFPVTPYAAKTLNIVAPDNKLMNAHVVGVDGHLSLFKAGDKISTFKYGSQLFLVAKGKENRIEVWTMQPEWMTLGGE